ncbi:uncharacterized protein Z520_08764 [Fonsecaea multimorphosa CBS 102226]|uniref:Holocytochrome c-type synthase n=1 Tax=Fonsecaea multimorphosa CBS 102226 TaxID=1442371 RepID=A0A0D2JYJ0_9EURO|nr:uncharacterized protein Z520_08764 [Fonsecaea multimorphosa CBS 102226]KIX95644.1 hypothetical protein Z520_08764 [Fonsecaea multimorphosa CBS 102226]OAL21246.1 hypothetical protein AYO22_08209 [Fonsecaea multimorphosa]
MGWWKADPGPAPEVLQAPPPAVSSIPPHAQFNHPQHPSIDSASASACPVDPKTREIWLQQAQQMKRPQSPVEATQTRAQTSQPSLPASHPPLPSRPAATISSQECSSDRISQGPSLETHSPASYQPAQPLSHGRVVSSIPRAFPQQSAQEPSHQTPTSTSTPANSESETGASAGGNWIYPSEHQFFHAVMRKQTLSSSNPSDLAQSISSIIPIHNAVNEQAWVLIKRWEKGTSDACGGPKLLSFQGLGAGAKSPKARWNSLWGYTEPFDRHDWVVQRCDGSKVEYVIDFYQGKASESKNGKQGNSALNFYLDVRPKLNTMEGWRMRAEQLFGLR